MVYYNCKKGKVWHEYKGTKYDVDTFYDELAWETVTLNRQKMNALYQIWGYAEASFPCPNCHSADYVKFIIEPTGVVARCELCKVAILVPPMDPESGRKFAELLEQKEIGLQELWDFATRTGYQIEEKEFQALPSDLKPIHKFGRKKSKTD